jgi:hypothetical protein
MTTDDDQFDDEGNPIEQPPPKKAPGAILREKYEAALRENAELKKSVEDSRKFQRQATIGKLLKDAGLSEDHAEFVPETVEATPEKVAAWLEAKGKLFGWEKPEPLSEEQQQARLDAARIAAATNGAPPAPPGITVERMKSMTFPELIQAGLINADD